MKSFSSQQVSIQRPAEDVFRFVSDFEKLGTLMPDKVVNWQSSNEGCSFEIQGMAKLQMRLTEKKEFTFLKLDSHGQNPFQYNLVIDVFPANEMRSEVSVTFNADLNPMLSMMASKPLQNLVDLMVEKLKEELEK